MLVGAARLRSPRSYLCPTFPPTCPSHPKAANEELLPWKRPSAPKLGRRRTTGTLSGEFAMQSVCASRSAGRGAALHSEGLHGTEASEDKV